MARRLHPVAALDHAHVWHPFTQMRDWLRSDPIVLVRGQGTVLEDARKRRYLDANSSIWTNLHGHRHPRLDAAITRQLGKVAHTSALGLAGEPSARLAAELVTAAAPITPTPHPNTAPLTKVFFSDDGSTAVETALKLAYEFTRRTRGPKPKPRFLSMDGAYHGDTVGAVSVGHIDLFHKAYGGLLFLPLPVQPGPTRARRRPHLSKVPVGMRSRRRSDLRACQTLGETVLCIRL
jgi:adenosylmethionine-8-amino-7-oxononanoate aminotransferase